MSVKNRTLWKFAVTTTVEAEDAVAELLSRIFGTCASSYTDAETQATTVAVFRERRPTRLEAMRKALRDGLHEIEACGLDIGLGRVRIQALPWEDWAESWKRHFKPIEIGNALLIKPSWNERRPRWGQAVVVLDPGLSFGTGQHPTTEFCLRELVRQRAAPERGRSPSAARTARGSNREFQRTPTSQPTATGDRAHSFLDVGTGSGILAIAAARLGYAPVHAFDFDPEAVRVARANARANGVSSRIRIMRADVTKSPRGLQRRFDVVCANLVSTLLIAERRTIAAMVKRSGLLVLAGILESEFNEVQTVYESLGLKLVASKAKKEWRSGSFIFARPVRYERNLWRHRTAVLSHGASHFNSRNDT